MAFGERVLRNVDGPSGIWQGFRELAHTGQGEGDIAAGTCDVWMAFWQGLFLDGQCFQHEFQSLVVVAQIAVSAAHIVMGCGEVGMTIWQDLFPDG